MQKVLGFFPHVEQDALGIRQTVGRKLHDKRHRAALEDGVFQQQTAQDSDDDAGDIQRGHYQRSVVREEGCGNHAVDRKLCTARHERSEHDGHLAVAVAREGAGCHDGRNAASKADEHWNKGASGQTNFAQKFVHDKGNSCHVAAVLQQREEEEQQNDDWKEGQNAADTGADAVDNQRGQPRCYLSDGEHPFQSGGKAVNPCAEQILQRRTDDREGQPEDDDHNQQEDRDAQVFVGEQPVDLFRAQLFAGFLMFDHTLCAQALDVGIAHICQCGFAVGAKVLLHLLDDVVDDVDVAGVQLQRLEHRFVALHQLGSGKTGRKAGCVGVVFDDMGDGVDGTVYFSLTEVQLLGRLLFLDRLDDDVQQVRDAFSLGSRDRNNRNAQRIGQLFDMDAVAAGTDLIHHVESQNHRDVQLHQLQSQIEVALQIGGVHNVDDGVRMLLHQKVTGDDLLRGVRRERVDARQIHQHSILVVLDRTFLFFNRDAREVADVLIAAGQRIEQRCFAAVLIACQREKIAHCTTSSISILAASSARMVST